jgi:hypothetical protein
MTMTVATKEEAEAQGRQVVDAWARDVPAFDLIRSRNPVFPVERDKEMFQAIAALFGVAELDASAVLTDLFKAMYRHAQPWPRLPFATTLQNGWYRGAASAFARGLGDLAIDRCWERSTLPSIRKKAKVRF